MMNLKNKVMLLGILAIIGVGMVAVAHLTDIMNVLSRGNGMGDQMEGTAIIMQSMSDNESINTTHMNMVIQQDGQVIQNVGMPLMNQQFQGQLQQASSGVSGGALHRINVPVDLSLRDMERGDVLFCEDGASLVVLNAGGSKQEALYLDFGLGKCKRYEKTGAVKVSDELMSILRDDDLSLWEKQFAIWYVEGLDSISLNVTWRDNVGDGFEDAIEKIRGISENQTQTLQDAVGDSRVKAEFESEGYSRIKIGLTENKRTQSILVERGFALKNHNENNQNIALGESMLIYLPYKKSKTFFVKSYCINQRRGSPGRDDELVVWKNVPENVQKVIDSNYVNGQVSNSIGQGNVWSETG